MNLEHTIYASIGSAIAEIRSRQRLTQEELANSIQMSRTSITNLEKGRQRIPVHTLFAIAQALKTPLSELLPEVTGLERTEPIRDALEVGRLSADEAEFLRGAM